MKKVSLFLLLMAAVALFAFQNCMKNYEPIAYPVDESEKQSHGESNRDGQDTTSDPTTDLDDSNSIERNYPYESQTNHYADLRVKTLDVTTQQVDAVLSIVDADDRSLTVQYEVAFTDSSGNLLCDPITGQTSYPNNADLALGCVLSATADVHVQIMAKRLTDSTYSHVRSYIVQ